MNRCFLSNPTALWVLGTRFRMFCYDIDAFYNCSVLFYKHIQNTTGFPFIFPGIYVNGIPFLYMQLIHCIIFL